MQTLKPKIINQRKRYYKIVLKHKVYKSLARCNGVYGLLTQKYTFIAYLQIKVTISNEYIGYVFIAIADNYHRVVDFYNILHLYIP